MKKIVAFVFMCFAIGANAQVVQDTTSVDSVPKHHFNYKALIVPTVLIGYGVIGIESDQLISFNTQIRSELVESIDEKLTIDDFSQYAPAASVFALDAFGIRAKHSLRDRALVMATSYLILSSTVLTLKSITNEMRPDGSSNNSFPSGHTATAFAGAEMMWQEYKDQSIWYGVAGYAVATGTGLFRMYNNRHWLTDVAAGAGIGILSTKIAYWVSPYLNRKLFGVWEKRVSFAPFYNGRQVGVGLVKAF